MEHNDVRNALIRFLRADVLGPQLDEEGGPQTNECLQEKGSPDGIYLIGKLHPNSEEQGVSLSPILPSDHEADITTSFDESEDRPVSSDEEKFMLPSSMGFTVCPLSGIEKLSLQLTWARYEKTEDGWLRIPHHYELKIDYGTMMFDAYADPINVDGQFLVHLRKGSEDHPTLSIRMQNIMMVPKAQRKSTYIIFQPEMRFSMGHVWQDVRSAVDPVRQDQTMMVLYADSDVFALGHNVGVNWDDDGNIWTDYLPEYTMNKMEENESLQTLLPDMNGLCDSDTISASLESLYDFVGAYDDWLNQQEHLLNTRFDQGLLSETLSARVREMVDAARLNSVRMREGIRFLLSDDMVRHAFLLSNRSIQFSQNEATHPDVSDRTDFQWRPFQLAFQLINIRSLCAFDISDVGFHERSIIDLAWFPTGGGKTEAYLGMIATVGFYRRLRFPEDERRLPAVHSIMRYTLRLLTSDQAGRLVRLVGAMNHIARGEEPDHNFTDFRVGMWVGEDASPNRLLGYDTTYPTPTAQQNLALLQNNLAEEKGTVIQFERCPWCGSQSLGEASSWEIGDLNNQPALKGRCQDDACLFHDGVPFTCVDDDIYINPPSVLLATADKFAQLARNPWAKSLPGGAAADSDAAQQFNARRMLGFGRDAARPPDLIIQDELHLLTGPLGTIAGLVETALETAWKDIDHRPKYIAATATIRGAQRDAMLMYGRDMNIFPPPVATAEDNFFAQLSGDDDAGRKHIGILGPPGKNRTTFAQPTASLLQRVQQLREGNPEEPDDIFDPYFTMVGYFNSLRELGGAQTALPDRVARQFMPKFAQQGGLENPRQLHTIKELTSRKTSSELKAVKDSLERSLPEEVVDVVVTTNMFQVGIDIGRLGLMAIVGQPKSNSEYIQSSGRVGRRFPGLVVSLLRSTFPRDQSHYENFKAFHQEVYSHVDLTSTTPFSQRALDRGMGTALAIMLRMRFDSLAQTYDLRNLGQSADLRASAIALVEAFKSTVEGREEHIHVRSPPDTVVQALETISRKFSNLSRFVEDCQRDNLRAIWVSRRNEANQQQRGWLRSEIGEFTNADVPLQSFRDVAPEVRVVERWNVQNEERVMTMPTNHVMAQAAPGNIWEKDGLSYLTLGVNNWAHGQGNLAYRFEGEGGLRIERETLQDILPPNTILRFLPTDQRHGAVTIDRYPGKYGFRCSNGHLSSWLNPGPGGHIQCQRAGCDALAHPTGFVSICSNGHLQPFDYSKWVHQPDGRWKSCQETADIDLEMGADAAHTLRDWTVVCRGCGARRSMELAPTITAENGPSCGGFRPWLTDDTQHREECNLGLMHRQVGSTNVTFNNGGSVLLIPLHVSWRYAKKLRDWGILGLLEAGVNREVFDQVVGTRHDELLSLLNETEFVQNGEINNDILHDACSQYLSHHSGQPADQVLTLANLRRRERIGLLNPDRASTYDPTEFSARGVVTLADESPYWASVASPVSQVIRVDRLTELRYISGITRLDPSEGLEQPIDLREGDRFGIARLHHGEGIYFEVKSTWLQATTNQRAERLSPEHAGMIPSMERLRYNIAQQLPSVESPNYQGGNSLTVLHSLSHLLIREVCLISGYSAGSISERLYLNHTEDGSIEYAGILLYTSGPSSDGTLGGLVRQATPEQLEVLLRRALAGLDDCSNDPVCADHTPSPTERNGAACHACLYLPETACELGNLFLDRSW